MTCKWEQARRETIYQLKDNHKLFKITPFVLKVLQQRYRMTILIHNCHETTVINNFSCMKFTLYNHCHDNKYTQYGICNTSDSVRIVQTIDFISLRLFTVRQFIKCHLLHVRLTCIVSFSFMAYSLTAYLALFPHLETFKLDKKHLSTSFRIVCY